MTVGAAMTSKTRLAVLTGVFGIELMLICMVCIWLLQPVSGPEGLGPINIIEVDPPPGHEYQPLFLVAVLSLLASVLLAVSCIKSRHA